MYLGFFSNVNNCLQVRDLHHLLAVLGKQLDEVVNNVVLVVVDSVAGVVRCKSIHIFCICLILN